MRDNDLAPLFAGLNLGNAPVAPVLPVLPADELVAPMIPVLPADAQRTYVRAVPVDEDDDAAEVVLGGGADNDLEVVRDHVRNLVVIVVARAEPEAGPGRAPVADGWVLVFLH